MKKDKNGNKKESNCLLVSAWEKNLDSYITSSVFDYNDAEIWKDSTFKTNLDISCKHSNVKKVLLFSSHYYVCESCGEEV